MTPHPARPDAAAGFRARHARPPQVVGRAPGRVNLIGEHVDYCGGDSLPIAIPLWTEVALAPRTDGVLRIAGRQRSESWEGRTADLTPGSVPGWPAYVAGVVWALAKDGIALAGADLYVDGEVPVGAGLASSAALTGATAVAVAGAVAGSSALPPSPTLVSACIAAEGRFVGAPTGGLDQAAVLLAAPGSALVVRDAAGRGRVDFRPEADGLRLLVVDTGVVHAHASPGDLPAYADRREEAARASAALGVSCGELATATLGAGPASLPAPLDRRVRHVRSEQRRVTEAVEALRRGDWAAVGAAMVASHESLRDDYEVSCAELDLVVETATAHGALGARMTGGGFGGSAIALVHAGRAEAVRGALTTAFASVGRVGPRCTEVHAVGGAGARWVTEPG